MSLPQVDAVLSMWQSRLSVMAENLLELQCNVTFQALTGTGGLSRVELTGATAKKVQPKLSAMQLLFEHYGLLQNVVQRAQVLRGGLPAVFGTTERLRSLEALLFGRCIEVAAEDVPLMERQLLSTSRRVIRISAEELLASMTRRFAEVRDAVACVERAWIEFSRRLDAVEGELDRFRSRVGHEGMAGASLQDLSVRLWGAKTIASTDPLSAIAELAHRVEPEVARASQQLRAR